jgi:ATP-dependent RNA helicase DeaD
MERSADRRRDPQARSGAPAARPAPERGDGDEDLDTANALLGRYSPQEVATAFARLYRQRLPAPEDVTDPGFAPPRREPARPGDHRERTRPAARADTDEGTWFRLNIGRNKNADPKWLLPMLCRRGAITRQDIGAIRIFERETKVQIRTETAGRFAAAVQGTEIAGIRIEPLGAQEHGRAISTKAPPSKRAPTKTAGRSAGRGRPA